MCPIRVLRRGPACGGDKTCDAIGIRAQKASDPQGALSSSPMRRPWGSLKCPHGLARPPHWTFAARAAYFGDRMCAFCDHRNPAGAKFCNECASPLHLKPCSKCDAVNHQAATNCYKCGAACPVLFGTSEATSVLPAADSYACVGKTKRHSRRGNRDGTALRHLDVPSGLALARARPVGFGGHRNDPNRGCLCRVPHQCRDPRRDGNRLATNRYP